MQQLIQTEPNEPCTQGLRAANVQLKAAFAASGRTYGSCRLCAVLQLQGLSIGRYWVRSLMHAHQLRSVWRRKFIHAIYSKHALIVAGNVLDRQFTQVFPNQAWVSDIAAAARCIWPLCWTCIRAR